MSYWQRKAVGDIRLSAHVPSPANAHNVVSQ